MSDQVGNHIVGFPTRRLIFFSVSASLPFILRYATKMKESAVLLSFFSANHFTGSV